MIEFLLVFRAVVFEFMANYGLKVSKIGFDVDTTQENLVFSSKFFTNKIFSTGTVNIVCTTFDAGTGKYYGYTTITHNLGYNPIFHCFGDIDGVRTRQGFIDIVNSLVVFRCSTSTTILTMEMWQTSSSTKTARYFILHDAGN